MPTKLRLQIHLEGSGEPASEHFRAFGSSVFESGLSGSHNASAKAYSVGRFAPFDPDVWQLDLAVADDRLVEVARSRLTRGTPVFLGSLRGELADGVTVTEHSSWEDLATSPRLSEARFTFVTPVHFRSSQRTITQPESLLIFRSLQERWRRWAPDSAPDVDFRAVDWLLHLEGESIVSTGPGRYDAHRGRRVANRIMVWTGVATVMIESASDADRCSLGALARVAPFLGVGANTTAGFGATEVTLSHADG